MSKKDDGGPAFVQSRIFEEVTLRDYFAGQVIATFAKGWPSGEAAREAYRIADAMLKERAK